MCERGERERDRDTKRERRKTQERATEGDKGRAHRVKYRRIEN